MTKNIAIVYHSGYGHTAKVALSVADGIKSTGNHVDILQADKLSEADWTTLDKADAIIFGAPTYMGGPSAPFKTFADASSKRWMSLAWKDKIAAGFTNSGSYSGDKLATLQQFMTLAMQHGMIWVGLAEMPPQPQGTNVPGIDQVNRIGSFSGLMTQSNNESAEITPPSGDLKTAHLFGERVAKVTAQFGA